VETTTQPKPTAAEAQRPLAGPDAGPPSPFSQQWATITKQEHIDLTARASYWEAQHARAKAEIDKLRQEVALKDAKIKDLQNRLFGKKSEKKRPLKSERDDQANTPSKRKRGQQPGSAGHGRTKRPDLPIIADERDLDENRKRCPTCGLPHLPNPALDEYSDVIEVEVKAHVRRIRRPAYTRNPGCTCPGTPEESTSQRLSEALIQGVHPQILDWHTGFPGRAELAATLGLAEAEPVGGVLAGAAETRSFDAGLEQHRAVCVDVLPVSGK
jgi:hypothetical protein